MEAEAEADAGDADGEQRRRRSLPASVDAREPELETASDAGRIWHRRMVVSARGAEAGTGTEGGRRGRGRKAAPPKELACVRGRARAWTRERAGRRPDGAGGQW